MVLSPWAYTHEGLILVYKIAVFVRWAYTQGAYTREFTVYYLILRCCFPGKTKFCYLVKQSSYLGASDNNKTMRRFAVTGMLATVTLHHTQQYALIVSDRFCMPLELPA